MTTSSQIEIEQKFAVDATTPLPDLGAVNGVGGKLSTDNFSLSAVYYDTEDLRLTRAKVTLRRRTGGNDAGWHVKTPASTGRTEIHAPIDPHAPTDQVPAALLAQLKHLIRALPLQPIAQVDNQRVETTYANPAGTPVLEMCDDHVTARSFLPGGEETTWREWEIELKNEVAGTTEGSDILAAAATALLDAGARESKSPSKLAFALGDSRDNAPVPLDKRAPLTTPGTPAHAVVMALREVRDQMVANDPKVRADEWDSVHKMRVATRELRSLLQTFRGIIDGPEVDHIQAELKDLAAVLGTARDAEVVEMRWEELLSSPTTSVLDAQSKEDMLHEINREYRRAHRKIVGALNSQRYFTVLEMLDELLYNPPIKQGGKAEPQAEEAHQLDAASTDAESAQSEQPKEAAREETANAAAPTASTAPTDSTAPDSSATETADGEDLTAADKAAEKAAEKARRKAKKKAAKKAAKKAQREMDAIMLRHLDKAYKRLVKSHKKAISHWDNDSIALEVREDYFHTMRKAAKKLRYAAAAAGESTDMDTTALYQACKRTQSVLGDFQDAVTSRNKLVELAPKARAHGKDTFGYGLMYECERRRGLDALSNYHGCFVKIKVAFKHLKKQL